MNPQLKRLREEYAQISKSIEIVQTRAATEERDMSDEELDLVAKTNERAKVLFSQIEMLTDQENRAADVADMAAKLEERAAGDTTTRTAKSGTEVKHRDPGHYRSEKDGGQNSFFGDIYKANALQNEGARTRLAEHQRALATGTEGPGLVAPHWLTEEYIGINRQGRMLADRVRNIPLGNDPRPLTLPKATAGTDANIVEQANENDATTFTNAFDSDVDTVTPKPTTGGQIVSRQMLDMATPAIDVVLYGDMIAAYNLKVEKKVGAAMLAAATNNQTFANEAAFNNAQDALDAVIDAAVASWNARKAPADIIAMGVQRFGRFLKLKDADGRKLINNDRVGSGVNSAGQASVLSGYANIEGLDAIATDGISTGAYADKFLVARASDTLLFEGSLMRFSYEQPLGPESIKLGIWAYTAVLCRNTSNLRTVTITAA